MIRRVVWGLAHLLLGLAFVRWRGVSRWIGLLFLLNAFRLLPRTLGAILGAESLATLAAGSWWFIVGTVPLFALLGVWLWQVDDTVAAGGSGSARIASPDPEEE